MVEINFIEVDVFSAAMLFIIFLNSRSKHSRTRQNHYLHMAMILTCVITIVDLFTNVLQRIPGQTINVLLYLFNMAYFILTGLITYSWFLFSQYTLYGKLVGNKWQRALQTMPLVILCALVLITPFAHTIFSIDSSNIYHRNFLYHVQTVVGLGYILAATIMALIRRSKEDTAERRRECVFIAAFTVLPFIGAVIQVIFPDYILTWPSSALSLLLVYINIQNHQISVDSLTKLNNRGELDKFLKANCVNNDKANSMYLMLLDVDDFKAINDTYGHIEGDETLKQVSSALKYAFEKVNANLYRYGGDEFAVVIFADEKTVKQKIIDFQIQLMSKDSMFAKKRDISVSIGYAKYQVGTYESPEQFIAEADRRMYQNKQSKK